MSKVRLAGTRLKTFGGRASGPEPLVELFKFVIKIFKNAQGRKLNSLECHDIMCKIGEVVVVGGVRRCLPEGSLVKTAEGFKKIEELMVNVDRVQVGGGEYTITGFAETGFQPVSAIITTGGIQTSTLNHEWLVYNHLSDSVEWLTTETIANAIKAGAKLSLVEQKN